MDREIRRNDIDFELREQDGKKIIEGYAIKWEALSQKIGMYYPFKEKFTRGSMTQTLKTFTQRALWNHDDNIVLGNTKNRKLKLTEDDIGLRFELDLPNSPNGENVYEAIKRKDVEGVSFGFRALEEEWDETDPKNVIRTIRKADLIEISPTAFPAYTQSSVTARNENNDKAYEILLENRNKKNMREYAIRKLRMGVLINDNIG